ncbi:c-type cytochrome [Deinococcus sonorensis]|uniref:C-type cytochrome n=2 Tax=Deinococcus sonorensis TaxID=309891 RepID=A0AAU7U3U1_9DEIO
MRRVVVPVAVLGALLAVGGVIYALRPVTPPEQPMPVGDVARGSTLVDQHYCADCHGGKGQPTNGDIPNLGGQQVDFLYKNMLLFHHRQGNLPDTMVTSMINVFPTLDAQQISDIATYYAAQKPVDPWPGIPGSNMTRARALYRNGDPARAVVACQICHAENARGDAARGTPSLLHQSPGYTLTYLRTVRASPPGNQPGQNAMHVETQHLTDDELKDLANYVATLTPGAAKP